MYNHDVYQLYTETCQLTVSKIVWVNVNENWHLSSIKKENYPLVILNNMV